jgi:hypothetical protein
MILRRVAIQKSCRGLVPLVALAAFAVGQQSSSPTQTQPSNQVVAPLAPVTPQQKSSPAPGSTSQDSQTQNSSGQDVPANGQGDTFVFRKQVQEVVLHATVVDERQRLASHLD